MIAEKPRFLTVQSLEDCEALRLSRKDFTAFADKHTWVLWTLLKAFAERINRMNVEALDLSIRDVPYRLLHAISDMVQRQGVAGPDGWRIPTALSAGDFAGMIGSNSDTVSRLLDQFETDGLIKRSGGQWIVPDPKELTRALEYVAQQGA